jgi:3-hydroxybutyryl-CoA dehydrogenase
MVVKTVAVIGAGAAGRAFALRCAAAGFDVVLEDVMPAKLRRAQDEYSELQAELPGSLRFAMTVEDAVASADVAVDFVPDELESKLEIFSLLDRMAPPRTILLTPTLALSITDLASCTYRPAICVALRGAVNGLLDPEVEVLQSWFADAAALEAVVALLARLGVVGRIVEDAEPMLVKNLTL